MPLICSLALSVELGATSEAQGQEQERWGWAANCLPYSLRLMSLLRNLSLQRSLIPPPQARELSYSLIEFFSFPEYLLGFPGNSS